MNFKFNLHSLIFLAGPSGSGKSTLSRDLKAKLEAKLEHEHGKPNVAVLSSDSMRQELLGYPYFKHDGIMMHSSKHAFEMLHYKCERLMRWPVSAQYIIIDATNLSSGNRKMFLDAAQRNHYSTYMVALDYRNIDEYEKYLDDRYNRKVVHKHIRKMRKDFYPDLNRRDFTDIYKVKTKDFSGLDVEIPRLNLWKNTFVPDIRTHIISDIHGCFTEFKEALTALGYGVKDGKLIVPENKQDSQIVLNGDWINKGSESLPLIDFLYDNLHHFILVHGNHENFINLWFAGKIDGKVSQEVLDNFFTLTHEIKNDPVRLSKFKVLYAASLPFVRSTSFFASHAPCEDKFLGKVDNIALRNQRNLRIARYDDERFKGFTDAEKVKYAEESLSFWKETAEVCHPWQFAGHLPLARICRIKNKYLIDGGCPHGGCLNHVTVVPGFKVFLGWVKKQTPTVQPEKLFSLFNESRRSQKNAVDLDDDGLRRLKWLATNKINFISGTMSPVEKDLEGNDLESFEKGLEYYKSKGVNKVVLQQKYMGSRCNLYLNLNDPTESYAVSRNGYKIRRKDLMEKLEALFVENVAKVKPLHPGQEWVVLDGELLPWSALGRGLIEETFKPIGYGIKHEKDFLVEAGFEELLNDAVKEVSEEGFVRDVTTKKKSEVIEKYGQSLHAKYRGLNTYKHIPLEGLDLLIQTYEEQIRLYGQHDIPLEFRGFAVLKTIDKDGAETTFFDRTNQEVFQLTGNDDPCVVIDLDNPDDIKIAKDFYLQTSLEKKMEGVVIKPWLVYNESVAPYLKARNPDYLTMVYGYDYKLDDKYEKLISRKNTRKKVSTSIAEFEIGKKMLEIRKVDISLDNEDYCNLVAQMFDQEKIEATLDPRL